MSLSNKNPDVEIPGLATGPPRGQLVRDAEACAREKNITTTGKASISVYVIAACGVAMVAAGAILGKAGNLFDYGSLFRVGYNRTPPSGESGEGLPPKMAMDAYQAKGMKVWTTKCITCHGPEAKGDGSNFPSLVGSAWALGETERFSMIILNGLHGPMSTGKTYSGAAGMPTQNPNKDMTAEELAGVMTYVRNHFGNNKGDVVTTEMARAAFEISAKRSKAGQQMTTEELTADHLKALPGKTLDPKAMVDPITLNPVFAGKKTESNTLSPAEAKAPAPAETPAPVK